MRIFSFDPIDVRDEYRTQGWLHIRKGTDPGFLDELTAFVQGSLDSSVVTGRGIGGTKQQAVYPFSDAPGAMTHLFDTLATLCDLTRETMTLSERHIKAYDADTPAEVPAHKDRLSSQVSVGFTIEVPAGSSLVLYPFDDRTINPFNVAGALRESLPPDRLPEVALEGAREVVIEDEPGDVMIFPGSTTWHKRRRAAGAVNLYLKFNDFNSDPLGEDPSTPERREQTLRSIEDGAISERTPTLARRLDTVTHQRTRVDGLEVVTADVWGQPPLRLTDAQLAVLRVIDGQRPVGQLASEQNGSGLEPSRVESEVRELAAKGVLDLL
jgi:hypothetical protein